MEKENTNKGTLYGLIIIAFAIILASGLSSFDIAVIDPESEFKTVTYYEDGFLNGDVYDTDFEITLGSGDIFYIVGANKDLEVAMGSRSVGAYSIGEIYVDIDLYEDITFTPTELLVAQNKNRNYENNNTLEIYYAIDGDVDLTGSTYLPFSNEIRGDRRTAVASESEKASYIMKNNTNYAIKIENKENSAVELRFKWEWLELKE